MNNRSIGLVAGSLAIGTLVFGAIVFFSRPGPVLDDAETAGSGSGAADRTSGRADEDRINQVRELVRGTPTPGGSAGRAETLDLQRGPGGVPQGMRVPKAEVQRMNEDGRLGQWYRAADSEPLEGGWVRLTEPSAWIYLSDQRMLVVDAERAHVFWPTEGRPERGRLDQGVHIRLFEVPEDAALDIYDLDPATADPVFEVVTNSLEFETSPYQVRTSDRVEVFTPRLDLAGRGMTLYFNEGEERVEYLHFERREYIRIRPDAVAAAVPAADPIAGATAPAGGADEGSSPSLTAAPGPQIAAAPSGRAATPSTAGPPPSRQSQPRTDATSEELDRPSWYRLTLTGGVEIVRGLLEDEIRITGETLEADFALGADGLESGLLTSASDSVVRPGRTGTPEPALAQHENLIAPIAQQASMTAGASPGRPAPLMHRLATLPFAASLGSGLAQPGSDVGGSKPQPHSADEIVILGGGALTLQPQADRPAAMAHVQDRRVVIQGQPVIMEGVQFRALCARAAYTELRSAIDPADAAADLATQSTLRLEPDSRRIVEMEWFGAGIARSRHPVVFVNPADGGPAPANGSGDVDAGQRAGDDADSVAIGGSGVSNSATKVADEHQRPRPTLIFEGPGEAATSREAMPDPMTGALWTTPTGFSSVGSTWAAPGSSALATTVVATLVGMGEAQPVPSSGSRTGDGRRSRDNAPTSSPAGGEASLPGVPAGFLITWEERLEIGFSREEASAAPAPGDRSQGEARGSDRIGSIESAEFFGNVKVDDPRGLALTADRLRAEFASLAAIRERMIAAGDPTAPSDAQGEADFDRRRPAAGGADDNPQLSWLEAEGAVEAVSSDGGVARGNRLEVTFAADLQSERSVPDAIVLVGTVYAMLNNDAIRHADYLRVDLAPIAPEVAAANVGDQAPIEADDPQAAESDVADAGGDVLSSLAGDELEVREVLARGNIHIALTDGLHAYGDMLIADPTTEFATLSGRPVVVRQGPLVFMSEQLAIDQANQTITANSPGRMVNLEAPPQASARDVENAGRLGVDAILAEARRRLGEPADAPSVLPEKFARGQIVELDLPAPAEPPSPLETPATGDDANAEANLIASRGAVSAASPSAPLSDWALTRVGWTEVAYFSDTDGLIEIAGDARVESLPNPAEFNAVDAERIRVRLSPRLKPNADEGEGPVASRITRAEPETGATAPASRASADAALGDHEVLEIEALGRESRPARVNSVRYADPLTRSEAEFRFALASPVIHYFRIAQRVECVGSGSLLVVDAGSEATDQTAVDGPAENTASADNADASSSRRNAGAPERSGPIRFSGRGETLITWTGSLTFDGVDQSASFRDDVYLLHRPPDQTVINLQAATLDVDVAPADASGENGQIASNSRTNDLLGFSGRQQNVRLEDFDAGGGVLVVTEERRIEAERMSYRDRLGLAELEGNREREEPVIIAPNLQRLNAAVPGETDAQRAQRTLEAARMRPLRAMKATWDLITDTVRIEEAMPIRGMRP